MLKPVDVLLVGVGGQGTILASKILCAAAISIGYDLKMSEIHGMAQRGGSVVTQVRLGEKVNSPMVEKGCAEVILAFEQLEGLRWLPYLKKGGTMIVNKQTISPVPVLAGLAEYPANVLEYIEQKVPGAVLLNALGKAIECGNAKAANVVLLGALASRLPIPLANWEKTLEETVPPKFLEVNQKAFKAGYDS